MSPHSRRDLLTGLTGLVVLSGCSLDRGEQEPATTRSADETTNPQLSLTLTADPTLSRTKTPVLSVYEFLPEPGGGWTRIETGDVINSPLNAEDDLRGDYRSPNGTVFRVIILQLPRPGVARFHAERLACEAGWSVSLQYRAFAIGASTGTVQKTFTPEKPPQMTRTAVPDTSADAKQLLERSAVLTEETIEQNVIESC